MVTRKSITRVCDRCPSGKEKKATHVGVMLSLGRYKWKLDLCDSCNMELDRVIWSWGRLGEEIEDQHVTRFTEATKVEGQRLAELRTAQKEVHEPKLVGKAIRVSGDALIGLPDDAHEWVFTTHAYERLTQRKISAARALKAAAAPTLVRQDLDRNPDPDVYVHITDGIQVVANVPQKVILTVAKVAR